MKLRNKKTGEIIKDAQYRSYSTRDGFVISTAIDKYPYKSLKEFCEDWEDYNLTKPLIKDERIRKAVRAWAELYDNTAIRAHLGEDYVSLFKDEVNGYSSSVEIDLSPEVFNELIDAHYYTIEELCGEEEE